MLHRLRATLIALLAAAILAGCSNTPKDPDEEIPPEVDEALGRDRPDYENRGVLEQIFMGSEESDSDEAAAEDTASDREVQRLKERLARMEQQLASGQQQSSAAGGGSAATATLITTTGLTPELGVWIESDDTSDVARRLRETLARSAAEAGLPFAGSDAISQRLSEAGCAAPGDPGCLGELAVYPGTRVLIAVQSAAIGNGAAVVTYRLMDTVLGQARPARTLRMPAPDGQLAQSALASAVDEMLVSATALFERAPWQTRAFNRQNGEWYLSAGRHAGLKTGDRLVVHAPGRTISTPGGNVAGWVPGAPKGRLEITGFAGDDIAVARLVEGEPPTPTDPILAADDDRPAGE